MGDLAGEMGGIVYSGFVFDGGLCHGALHDWLRVAGDEIDSSQISYRGIGIK
jgi:hypothetical protein